MDNPEYEVAETHRWVDWPEREPLTGLDGRDIGIDLVAKLRNGGWVAIQCKCYDETRRVGKPDIDSFLAVTQRAPFSMRWIVAPCAWTENAENQILRMAPPVRRIDFMRHWDDPIAEQAAKRPVRDPWPLQAEAIGNVVVGLGVHDRGRLVMACGTGKTFSALRVAERVVPTGGRVLFLAPSIALVSQARREWLLHTRRELSCRVVCSDVRERLPRCILGERGILIDESRPGLASRLCFDAARPRPSRGPAPLTHRSDGQARRERMAPFTSVGDLGSER